MTAPCRRSLSNRNWPRSSADRKRDIANRAADLLTLSPNVDARGCPLTGATTGAIAHFEAALAASVAWRGGAERLLQPALEEAPEFAMAQVLQAYLMLLGRDVRNVERARAVYQSLVRLDSSNLTYRERLHILAIGAALSDDYERSKALLSVILRHFPLDLLALQIAHSWDYLTGDQSGLRSRVEAILPAWSPLLPGYHAALAMHAFSLAESGSLAAAERSARLALEMNPNDARAHHAMAHIFEAGGRYADGIKWMDNHATVWTTSTAVATHCAWHLALFHLRHSGTSAALSIYDQHIRPRVADAEVADLIDASSLLWRIDLSGGRNGLRWQELADEWEERIADDFCSFSDVHAMLAFVGGRRWRLARAMHDRLRVSARMLSRYADTTRSLGLSGARAIVAFGQGDNEAAAFLLRKILIDAHRLGGSQAQRDVLLITLQAATERMQRPRWFGRLATSS